MQFEVKLSHGSCNLHNELYLKGRLKYNPKMKILGNKVYKQH